MPDRPRVLVIDDWNEFSATSPHLERLRASAEVVVYGDHPDKATLKTRLRDADALILWRERTRLDAELLEAAKKLKIISQTGYSWRHIDMPVARARGVILTARASTLSSSPIPSATAMAEFNLGLIINLAYHISYCDRHMRTEPWPAVLTTLVWGKVLGIVGYGGIGRELAKKAAAIGIRVHVWGRSLPLGTEVAPGVVAVSLESLMSASDFVSVLLALNGGTRGLVSRDLLELMRPTAYFVNTSRAAISDEKALGELLQQGRIAGAALDVYDTEPLSMDHPLRGLDNVLLCPHIGWTGREVQDRMLNDAVDNLVAFFKGTPVHVVDGNT
jgi:phosphoglycerate dehydrogenase-like enzyme